MNGEPTPAGADFQQVIAGGELEFAADPVVFGDGSTPQGRLRGFKDATGIGQGFIQEQCVKVISQVVVGRYVDLASFLGVLAEEMKDW